MKKTTAILLVLLGCGAGLFAAWYFLAGFFRSSAEFTTSTEIESATPSMPLPATGQPDHKSRDVEYRVETSLPGVVHILIVPVEAGFVVTPAIAETVMTIDQFAQKTEAIAAINAGFFDPENQQSTSYVTVQGKQVADPKQNDRLVNNPDLAAYLPKIFDRSEFRRYQCGQEIRYDIAPHSAPIPADCQLLDAIGGGPQLLPDNTALAEGFVDYQNGEMIRDPLGISLANARSAIGITRNGDIVLVMAGQSETSPSSGLALAELATLMKTIGAEKALNLDGGSSASFYYQGKTVYGKRDDVGFVQRPVKSVLLVKPGR